MTLACYARLPSSVREQAGVPTGSGEPSRRILESRFKRVNDREPIFSARVGIWLEPWSPGRRHGYLFWIGSHAE